MGRLSTVDRIPVEHRDLIRRMRREDGRTIDEIADYLRSLGIPVSRSAVGRHIKCLDVATELGLADELLRQRRAINSLSRRVAELSASIERIIRGQT